MLFPPPHRWDLSPQEAIALQAQLASRIVLSDDTGEIRLLAGADMSIDVASNTGFAGVIVFDFKTFEVVEQVFASGPLELPYIPGLLSFREGPILLKAFEKLKAVPDLILFDGQGIAHPRRLGIASHMGLLLDRPSIGCGKSLLYGTYEEPGLKKGDRSPLKVRSSQEVIGTVLRTKDRVKPIFISPGYRVGHQRSVDVVLRCLDGYRIPKPTRLADRWVGKLKIENKNDQLDLID